MNNWKSIWNKRKSKVENDILDSLIIADGFDRGAGKIGNQEWIEYTCWIGDKLGIQMGDSIFEVGCGAGAMLYDYCYNMKCKVAGVDYSIEQIKIAKKVMPEMDFNVMEAINIANKDKFDYVFSNGCFEYFPDKDYAKTVLMKMISKAKKAVAVLDTNDIELFDLAKKIRKGALSEGEYENKYKGFEHLFFSRQYFEDIAKEKGLEIEIFNQNIKNYLNGKFRFNVIICK